MTTPRTRSLSRARDAVPTAAWVGFVGSCILAAGRLSWMAHGDVLQHTWWGERVNAAFDEHATGAITVLGASVMLLAWLRLRRECAGDRPRFWTVFIAWAVPLLPLAGILSSDARFYSDIGWMVSRGDDPYVTGLGTTGSPFRVGDTWHGTLAVYPPLAVRLMGLITSVTGAHWYWTVVAMRLLALIGLGLLAWALPRLAKHARVDPRLALWLGIFNPLTFLHGFGGMHIDMLMAGVMAVALVLATTRGGLLWGALVAGVAASVKQPGLLVAVPVALLAPSTRTESWPRTIGRTALAVAIAVSSMLATGFLCGFGTRTFAAAQAGAAAMNSIKTVSPAYLVSEAVVTVRTLLGWTTHEALFGAMQTVALVAAAVVMVVLFVRCRHRPFSFLAGAALAFGLGSPGFREWYLLMWISFAGLVQLGRWMRRSISLLVPFTAVYSAFKSYLAWDIVPSFCASTAIAIAANANGWLLTGATSDPPPAGPPPGAPAPGDSSASAPATPDAAVVAEGQGGRS